MDFYMRFSLTPINGMYPNPYNIHWILFVSALSLWLLSQDSIIFYPLEFIFQLGLISKSG